MKIAIFRRRASQPAKQSASQLKHQASSQGDGGIKHFNQLLATAADGLAHQANRIS